MTARGFEPVLASVPKKKVHGKNIKINYFLHDLNQTTMATTPEGHLETLQLSSNYLQFIANAIKKIKPAHDLHMEHRELYNPTPQHVHNQHKTHHCKTPISQLCVQPVRRDFNRIKYMGINKRIKIMINHIKWAVGSWNSETSKN